MKTLYAITLLCLFSLHLVAQEEQQATTASNGKKPAMWLGGEVTFGSMSSRDFTFGPDFGLMIGKNIGVGSMLMFSSGNSSFAWGVEPYFRYYLPVADQFKFYGDAFIGVGGGDNNTDIDGGDFNTLDFGARAGLQYWFTPKWSVAASTNILSYTSTNNNGEFGAGINFNSVWFSLFFHF
jgi:hypothetical protein